MAFGSSMKDAPQAQTPTEKKTFVTQWIDPLRAPYRTGRRVFRILPMVEDGEVVKGDDGFGVTPTEVRWAEFWIPVLDGDRQRQQRVMVDWQAAFKNPVWQRLYEEMPKEKNGKPNPERKTPKQRFALNVLDRTKVLFGPNGEIAYPNENNEYYYYNNGNLERLTGTPKPLNQVRILEGSAGKPGGKHMLQALVDFVGTVTRPDDESERPLHLHEFDLAVKITGESTETRRVFQLASNFSPLADADILLPRYDIATWATPWPHEALDALIDGADINEVVTEYSLVLYPQLENVEEDETPF